jgi:hypothetical protein
MISDDTTSPSSVDFNSSTKATQTYYPLSSLYNISSTPVNALNSTNLSKSLSGVLISEATKKFTGVYPIYTNGADSKESNKTNSTFNYNTPNDYSAERKLGLMNETKTLYLDFGEADTDPSKP